MSKLDRWRVCKDFRSGVGSGFAHVVLGFDLSEDRRV